MDSRAAWFTAYTENCPLPFGLRVDTVRAERRARQRAGAFTIALLVVIHLRARNGKDHVDRAWVFESMA